MELRVPILLAALGTLGCSTTDLSTDGGWMTGVWTKVGSLRTPREEHQAVLLPGRGQVLIIGGVDGAGNILASVEIYDTAARAVSAAASMAVARKQHAVALLADGTVLVAGGLTHSGATDAVEIYDPTTDTWSAGSRLKSPRFQHGAVPLNERTAVLVAGGLSAPFGEVVPTAEIYEMSKRAWRLAGSLKQGRRAPTVTALSEGRVLVAGGALHLGALKSTEIYDPKLDAWVQGPSMSTERLGHAASRLFDGRVLLAGGETASVDLFDPRFGLIPLADLGSDRTGHTLTSTGADGRVVIVGGQGAGGSAEGYFAAVHLFDGAVKSWGTADSLLGTPRRDHRATLLLSGQILVSGGRDQSGPLGSLELSRSYGAGSLQDGGIPTDADGAGTTDADGAGATDADGAGTTDADGSGVLIRFDGVAGAGDGLTVKPEEGCSCTTILAPPVGSWWPLMLVLLLLLRRRGLTS